MQIINISVWHISRYQCEARFCIRGFDFLCAEMEDVNFA